MPAQNIDKERFIRNFDKYMKNTDSQVDNWLYSKYLHDDITTIIHNVCYYWEFTDPRLTYEDVEADLLVHLQLKKDRLRAYSGNWYNIVFTMMRRKLFDILRSHRDEDANLGKMYEFCTHIKNSIEENNTILEYELEQPEPEQRNQTEEPALLSVQGMEADQVYEDTAGAAMQSMRRERKANTRKRNRPYNSDKYGLQLTFGFYEFTTSV